MIADKSQVLEAAQTLSETDRRELIDALLRSLADEGGSRDAWIEECRQRLAAYDRGESTAVPLTDVFPELA